jgi:hypothetical protein
LPRRKAVAATAIASSPNATMYAPYTRKRTVMNSAVSGAVPVRSYQVDLLVSFGLVDDSCMVASCNLYRMNQASCSI